MFLGYNTNGFAHHDPVAALDLLAEIGYRSVALTIDHALLNPYGADPAGEVDRYRRLLARLGLRSVVETGARFLLDPRRKHEPTLVSPQADERARRVDFLCRSIDIAAALGSDCVSLWAGVLHDGAPPATAWSRLAESLSAVLEHAERRDVVVGFEPEPGMLIDTLKTFDRLKQQLPSDRLQLTLDVGHLHCQGELPISEQIAAFGSSIVNVHIEDMRHGVHEHLMFGEGEIDFPPVIAALAATGYGGGLHVELSRHSHAAVDAARQAFRFLQPLVERNAPRAR
ncbi:MAG TPA: sugar phosphate isomerase/epimerase family protein [Pirellulales bacterium]|jgi:sugar phosphate isomerase/epimerase|nr:sugar phosphate isomerase/epimerase family protein [Pirellulales bacterium]